MNYPAAGCEVSNYPPPWRGGDEGEGVEIFISNTPLLNPLPQGERELFGNPDAKHRGFL